MGSGGGTVTLVFASLFVTGALVCVALSFATDHWIETLVQRNELKIQAKANAALEGRLQTPLYFTRYRGLFRTCYPGNETKFLEDTSAKNKVVPGGCIKEGGYEVERSPDTIAWGDDYETRIHLMRAHFAFFIVALLFFVISAILGAVGCWRMSGRILRATGLITFLGAFCALGGMAFFHGYEYLENQKINVNNMYDHFPAYWLHAHEHYSLQDYHYIRYGYSYMLGWIGVGLSAMSAILFLCAAMSVQDAFDDDRDPLEMKGRNRAYEYMQQQPAYMQQQSAVMPPQQPQPQYAYGDYGSQMAPQPVHYGYPGSNLGYGGY